jgi:hypothetical protein
MNLGIESASPKTNTVYSAPDPHYLALMDPDPYPHSAIRISSVPDPDPPDPHVFGPPGSGS